jgi:imidazole glycerol-phosphate synthase subunit HisF
MIKPRVIPCLLLQNQGLVKTIKFKEPKYLGDPINIVRIFNEKEVDELVLLDIKATVERRKPSFDLLEKIASECFMPLCYGGGIVSLEDMRVLFNLGIEKVSINSYAVENPWFIERAADLFGTQSIIVSIDVKKNWLGKYEIFTRGGRKAAGLDPVKFAVEMAHRGAGELFLNSINQDGTRLGYDIELIKSVTRAVEIPVVACGGAGKFQDLIDAVKKGGASAAASGSLFVFQGPHRAVLISYPTPHELRNLSQQ